MNWVTVPGICKLKSLEKNSGVLGKRAKSQLDPAPRGGIRGRVPQMTACAPQTKIVPPPSEDCAPKKLTGSGLLECKSWAKLFFFCGLTPDYMTFLGWRPFILEITCFRPEKPLEFPISAEKYLRKSVKTFFFFEITCFRPEKPLEFPISAGKFLWIFAPHHVDLNQTGINF